MLFPPNVQAEIYKCTNAKGSVYYNDKPCSVKDEEKKMNAVNDVVNGYTPALPTARPSQFQVMKKDSPDNKQHNYLQNKPKEKKKQITDKKASNTNEPSTTNIGMNSLGLSITNQRELSKEEQEVLFIEMHAGEVADEK